MKELVERIRRCARERMVFMPHAVRQMARAERMITTGEVEAVVREGEVIEEYPEDVRGHSCLMHGVVGEGRHIHVVCAPKEGYLAIITAYVPDPGQWTDDYRERK